MSKSDQATFVFEVCAQCSGHQWNTRHDEAKYVAVFNQVAAAIKAEVPNANCIMNKVPKAWFEKEIYCQLIPNEDDNNPYYDILPRIGAFEVSTVIDNVDILFYSKQMSTMWPHAPALAQRIAEAMNENSDAQSIKSKWQTTGRQVRQARGRRGSAAGMSESKTSLQAMQMEPEQPRQESQQHQAQEAEPEQQQMQQPAQEEVKQAEPAAQPKPAEKPAQATPAAPAKEEAPKEAPAQAAPAQAAPAQAAPAEAPTQAALAQVAPAQAAPAQAAPAQAAPAQAAPAQASAPAQAP